MNSLQLNELVQKIEHAFGDDIVMTEKPLSAVEKEILDTVIRGDAYQAHLQDEVNRQIIKDYLLNAVMLECISDKSFAKLSRHASSFEGRSSLSLHMLMASVESADEIAAQIPPEGLNVLRPAPDAPPHMVIVKS